MRGLASMTLAAVTSVTALTGLVGCRGETSRETPIVPIRNMYVQPRYNMQNESEFFEDKRTMRAPVEGTISKEEEVDSRVAKGRTEDDSAYVAVVPNEMIARHGGMEGLVKRGQDRFNVYCTPCHDKTGSGDGMIIKHGMLKPPSFHQDRLRHAPDGQIFATISNGVRNMPAYAPQIPVDDRWAIVSYVRALQLSQAPIASETKP